MNRHSVFAACTLLLAATGTASAQADMMAQARAMSANQLGLMEYCQAKGYAGADAVAAQKASMDLMPAGGSTEMDAMEKLGKSGTLSMNGTVMTLNKMASEHGSTEQAMCTQMASAAVQSAAMMKNNGMATGMPMVPGGMPTMPGMPSMTGMPGMPAMPAR